MKKLVSVCAFLFLAFTFNVQAQKKVVLAESFDESDGTPSGVYDSWDIKSDGGYVYIVYLNDGKKITKPLSLWVDKKDENGDYVAFSTLEFEIDKKHTFATYDYLLEEDGDYYFQVVDENENVLADTYAKVNYIEGVKPTKNDDTEVSDEKEGDDDDDHEIDTYYYEDSKVEFAYKVSSTGIAENPQEEFLFIRVGNKIQILFDNGKEIKTSSVTFSIYGGKDYSEEIETFDVDVDPTWGWFKVEQLFLTKGKYVVDIYSEDDIFMNSGYIEIK